MDGIKKTAIFCTAAAALVLCGSAPVARAQQGCGAEPATMKPVNGPGCANMVHRCGCDSRGCSWVWVCSKPDGGFSSTYQAPQASVFTPIVNPQDIALKAQEIRNLELQNQLKQQEIDAARSQRQQQRAKTAPTPANELPGASPRLVVEEGTVLLNSAGHGYLLLPAGYLDAYFCTVGSRDDHVTIGFSSLVFTITEGEPGQKITWACVPQ
jgi:hypothetical protein